MMVDWLLNLMKRFSKKEKPKNVQERFIEWLQPKGVEYLNNIIEEHGTLIAVWNEGGIPHPVHFREGMQIRNWMREQPEFSADKLDDHWFDNNWHKFTEGCLKGEQYD